MATRKEAEAAKKQQLKDGKKAKDLEKGRKINAEKNGSKPAKRSSTSINLADGGTIRRAGGVRG